MTVEVEPAAAGVRVAAADWPGAPWFAGVLLALGLPLLAWSAVQARPVEAGGAVVFTGLGALAGWLALAKRRDLVVERTGTSVRVRGCEGAGPFRRPVDLALPADTRVRIDAFAVPEGAPDIPDRGGDLSLVWTGGKLLLARRTGPGWRDDLDRAARSMGLEPVNRDPPTARA